MQAMMASTCGLSTFEVEAGDKLKVTLSYTVSLKLVWAA